MNPVSRLLVFFVCSIAAAAMHACGLLEGLERRIHDRLVRLATSADPHAAYPIATFRVDPANASLGLTRDEVLAALKSIARIRVATAVIAAPDPVPPDLVKSARALASATVKIGRTVLVLGQGADEVPRGARLVREGRGPDLQDGPRSANSSLLKPLLDSATRLAIADVEPDPDGVVREFAVAYGVHDATCPSLPVAVAACVLKESSLRFSSDLMTLETFGGRDITIAAPNTLRFKLHRERVYAPQPLTAEALDRIAVDSDARDARYPIVFVAFSGSPLLREVATNLGDRRSGLEIVADATSNLLDDDTIHELPWRASRAIVVVLPILIGAVPAFAPRRKIGWLAFAVAGSYALIVCGAALAFSLLLPVAGVLFGLVLGFLAIVFYRSGRPRIG